MLKHLLLILLVAVGIASARVASAASFSAVSSKASVVVGETFIIHVLIDSAGASVNTAQATLSFDSKDIEIVRVDRQGSVFGFWLQDPFISNEQGTVSFIGGSAASFSGRSLEVLNMTVKTKRPGTLSLVFSEGAINAGDGSGENILTTMNDLVLTSTVSTGTPVSLIHQVKRKPLSTGLVPIEPILTVPLYPDPQKWYGQISPFLVSWNLPKDVTGVATILNKEPLSAPSVIEGVFDNKIFVIPDSGIWYVHVRFKNDRGWGSAAHARIAVDSVPPLPFTVRVSTDRHADEPRPMIEFMTTDPVADIDHYEIRVDDHEAIVTTDTMYHVPLLDPGSHAIIVAAYDPAGNITEAHTDVVIAPLPAVSIAVVSPGETADNGMRRSYLYVSGSSLPRARVSLALKNEHGQYLESYQTIASDTGSWSFSTEHLPSSGMYRIEAFQEDDRGAKSIPVESESILIQSQTGFRLQAPRIVFGLIGIALLALAGVLVQRVSRKSENAVRLTAPVSKRFREVSRQIQTDIEDISAVSAKQKHSRGILRMYQYLRDVHRRLRSWIGRQED